MKNIDIFIEKWANLVESKDETVLEDVNPEKVEANNRTVAELMNDLETRIQDIGKFGVESTFVTALMLLVDPNGKEIDDVVEWFDRISMDKKDKFPELSDKYGQMGEFFKKLKLLAKKIKMFGESLESLSGIRETQDAKTQMLIMAMDENGYEQDGDGLEFVNLTGEGPERISFEDEKELEDFIRKNIFRK